MSKEYIADKETLDEVNQKVGVNTDAASGTSLFAKVNSLLNTVANHVAAWTSTRAAKLDNLDNIGATSDTGGSTTAGTVLAKLNALLTSWTSTRAGYIDNIRSYTITNNTASKTGVLSAKLAYIISLLENATYGLSAIKSNGVIKSIQRGTSSINRTSVNIAISEVDIAKAIVLIDGAGVYGSSSSTSGSSPYLADFSSTNLTIDPGYTSGTSYVPHSFSWQVIEFA